MDDKKKIPEPHVQEKDVEKAIELVEEERWEMDDYLEDQGIYIRQ